MWSAIHRENTSYEGSGLAMLLFDVGRKRQQKRKPASFCVSVRHPSWVRPAPSAWSKKKCRWSGRLVRALSLLCYTVLRRHLACCQCHHGEIWRSTFSSRWAKFVAVWLKKKNNIPAMTSFVAFLVCPGASDRRREIVLEILWVHEQQRLWYKNITAVQIIAMLINRFVIVDVCMYVHCT